MPDEVAIVFTAKSTERILQEGGSSAWRLNRGHAKRCKYVVCTRNAHSEWGDGVEAHHAAFLVGKIYDVVPCDATPESHEAEKDRYLIQFSEFARTNIPNVWAGDRNPVKYRLFAEVGIDFSTLKWEPMPKRESSPAPIAESFKAPRAAIGPLTMAEAKKGLALTFNVPPDSIEITIRG